MSLFLIFSMPVAWLFLVSGTARLGASGDNLKAFARGIAFFVPAALVRWLAADLMPEFHGTAFYILRPWFRDFFLFPLFGAAGFLLLDRGTASGPDRFGRRLSFMMGLMSLTGLFSVIEGIPAPGLYSVLVLPCLKIALAVGISLLLDAAADEYGPRLALLVFAAFATTVACAVVPLLWHAARPILGTLLAAGLSGASVWAFTRKTT